MSVSAILLAAGRSTRMGETNKLLVTIDGKAMVRHVAENLLSSKIDEIVVVTGHMDNEVRAALSNLSLRFVHNVSYRDGLSTSLKAGIASLGEEVEAALIALGDMPFVDGQAFDAILDAYKKHETAKIIASTYLGKRGNPVLWPRDFFSDLQNLKGDKGARNLIKLHEDLLVQAEIGQAALMDIDTPEALNAVKGVGL